ncbi:hydrolase [Streptomyces phage Annadreamy]|uniref:Hydrolase n=2 Tax=Annadreamyvirus annadreamy TaxID=2846392 RepID=A0A345GTN0_9CAUD|nr:minor tail protein [Streptomyces phage Annadreamy]AXG66302.1 hydrolase [Streptomyces phage Annadreamy]QGH79525.1 hydrolase [Streptomyces phage Limpid]
MYKKTAVIGTLLSAMGVTVLVPASAEAATSTQQKAYNFAYAQYKQGDKYSYGATGFRYYDCSGLIWRSFEQSGKKWKRYNAHDMRRYQTNDITVNQRKVGDLIFFKRKGSSTYTHVGIYAGSGYMVNAVNGNTYKGVRKGKVVDGYWNKYYNADYRRVK